MEDFLVAYEKALGVMKPACDSVGIHRKTIWTWRQKYPEFDERCRECEEVAVDFVEAKLYKLIDKGAEASTIFYLKTKGKHRGYVEKQEIDMSAEVKGVTVNVTSQESAQILQDIIDKDKTNK